MEVKVGMYGFHLTVRFFDNCGGGLFISHARECLFLGGRMGENRIDISLSK